MENPTSLRLRVVSCAWLACAGLAVGACSGRSQYCAWSGNRSVTGSGPATPTWFDQTSDSVGIWLISTGTMDAISISLTNLTADFDLYIRLPSPPAPTACSCGSEDPIYYRISDSGGLPGLADECEYLTLADLAPHTCILAVAYCKTPGGGSFDFQITCHVGAGPGPGTCAGPPPPPPPTCTLTAPGGSVGGDIPLGIDTASASSPTVEALFEVSTDGGATYSPCTAGVGSPLPNPSGVIPVGLGTFDWDSLADGVGTPTPQPAVRVRATVDDGVSPVPGLCETSMTVDNSQGCPTFCGDCDSNSLGPTILDALTAAQLSAGILQPTPDQQACCDVDASTTLTVLDALKIAQAAAGLPTSLACP